MKRKSLLTICVCLLFVLAACGEKEKPEPTPEPTKLEKPEATATAVPTETVEVTVAPTEESVVEPTETLEATATATPTPEPTEAPSSSYTWAGTKMPIPEPPYEYESDVSQRNGSINVRVTSTNGGEGGDVTHSKILEYCEDIKAAGFTLNLSENVIGERYGRTCYAFNAKNADGSSVELLDDGGGVMLYVTIAESGSEKETASSAAFDTSWASNEFEMLIPQPPVGEDSWKTTNKDTNVYRIETYGSNLNVTVFKEYVDLLSSYGFTIEVVMEDYIYLATDANGNEVKLLRESNIHQYTITKKK